MKQMLYILFAVLCLGCACVLAQNVVNKGENAMNSINDKKILVTYFSWGGNTKHIAETIQKELISKGNEADIFEIKSKSEYPKDYHETTVVAKDEIQKNVKVELKNNTDVSKYDVIFVGTPAWWYTMAPVVKTFLEENDFQGKMIVPFITHGGGGEYKIANEMGKYAKGSTVLKSISIYGRGNSSTQNEIKEWLNNL